MKNELCQIKRFLNFTKAILNFFAIGFIISISFHPAGSQTHQQRVNATFMGSNMETDILVFEATPAGIIASIAAAKEGYHVVMITKERHIGGLRTSGLSMPNVGVSETFGGLGREFHERVHHYYIKKYGADSEQVNNCQEGFRFEPHVAEKIFLDWLLESGVEILNEELVISVQKEGTKIISVHTDQNRKISASIFIDASYVGDLLKMANCSYRVGREGSQEYGETFAGIRFPPEKAGQADDKTQRFGYRVVLTDIPENQIPITKPENYHPASYMIDAASLRNNPPKSLREVISLNMVPNRKTDARVGEWSGSGSFLGGSFAYPEASHEERNQIEKMHREYAQGFLWFLLTDESVPLQVRQEMGNWGYAKDEFVDNNHWPYEIYVREARRLVGNFVMTEKDVLEDRYKPDGVAIGSYRLDVHRVQYVRIQNSTNSEIADYGGLYGNWGIVMEGGISHHLQPYEIPFKTMLPKRAEASNLLVPVCLSASHVAFSTIRMEPVWMMLGHAAGLAASISLMQEVNLHDLSTDLLRSRLIEQKAILDAKPFQK